MTSKASIHIPLRPPPGQLQLEMAIWELPVLEPHFFAAQLLPVLQCMAQAEQSLHTAVVTTIELQAVVTATLYKQIATMPHPKTWSPGLVGGLATVCRLAKSPQPFHPPWNMHGGSTLPVLAHTASGIVTARLCTQA